MSNKEKILIKTLEKLNSKTSAAVVIQMTVQFNGPLSDECAQKVKELLEAMHE